MHTRLFNFLLTVSLILASLVALPTHAAQNATKSAQTIVVLGDSLSAAYGIAQAEGWVALLQQRLTQQKYATKVVNASISGETTSGGLNRIEALLAKQKPNIIIIALGANDGLRGLSVDEMRRNLSSMLQMAANTPQKTKILLVGMKIPPNYGIAYTRDFYTSYEQLAKQHNTRYLPFLLEGVAANPKLIQADGLHPIAAAQPRLLNNVWAQLKPLLKKPKK